MFKAYYYIVNMQRTFTYIPDIVCLFCRRFEL